MLHDVQKIKKRYRFQRFNFNFLQENVLQFKS